jgi:hypothetical protein
LIVPEERNRAHLIFPEGEIVSAPVAVCRPLNQCALS